MANICLTFSTTVPASKLLEAVSTIDGLAAWWTTGTSGDPKLNGVIAFRFGENGGFDMRVVQCNQNNVHWECIDGPEDWVGTHIEFNLQQEDNCTRLMFRHAGWKAENSFFHHCSMKWATFLLSLKDLVERGKGRAFPDDLKIEAEGM